MRGFAIAAAQCVLALGCDTVDLERPAEQTDHAENGDGLGVFLPSQNDAGGFTARLRSYDVQRCNADEYTRINPLDDAPEGFQWVVTIALGSADGVGELLPLYQNPEGSDGRFVTFYARNRHADGGWEEEGVITEGCDGGAAYVEILERADTRVVLELHEVCLVDHGDNVGDKPVDVRLSGPFQLELCQGF